MVACKLLPVDNNDSVKFIKMDPDKVLTDGEKSSFTNVHKQYASVFTQNVGTYNDKSGKVLADVLLGNNKPVPKKGKIPSYNSSKSSILQDKFDELIDLGVLSHPEDVHVTVIHTSPSFLVKKSNGSYRLVTSFVELNKYIRPLPIKMNTTEDVITSLGKWTYIIKTDLKSSYYQIKMSPSSKQWLGTNSPYKGLYVYNRAPMGLRNMAEYLEEVVARVLGDCLAEGILTKISDDMFVGGNTINELLQNWGKVLNRLSENNLTLSADKTVICPTSVKVVGWIWKNGQLAVDTHRINPLTVCKPPEKVKQMRSFIGAFRIVTRCIPNYAGCLSELEDVVAGRESSEKIIWNERLSKIFSSAQQALRNPKTIMLPHPNDQLFLVSDGCNSPAAVGGTLYIKRGDKFYIGGFFSAKVKKQQLLWLPCEIEALGINLSINHFSNFIRESKHCTKILTDSKACVQAFNILSQGGFSLSPRISSFLMNLNSMNLTINHISGSSIPLTDFSSRNPVECTDKSCQLCQFVTEHLDIAVSGVSVEKILDGSLKMPFHNFSAWKEAQKQDPYLRRTYSQLLSGTRPGKKEKRTC